MKFTHISNPYISGRSIVLTYVTIEHPCEVTYEEFNRTSILALELSWKFKFKVTRISNAYIPESVLRTYVTIEHLVKSYMGSTATPSHLTLKGQIKDHRVIFQGVLSAVRKRGEKYILLLNTNRKAYMENLAALLTWHWVTLKCLLKVVQWYGTYLILHTIAKLNWILVCMQHYNCVAGRVASVHETGVHCV